MKRLALALVLLTLARVSPAAVRPATESFLPSVAHAPGALPGSEFRTDLWLFNPGSAPASVAVHFHHRDNAAPPEVEVVELEGGEVREIADAVLELFGLTNAVGGLRFVATQPIIITARVYDVAVEGSFGTGTAGQFDAATPIAEAIRAGGATDVIGARAVQAGATRVWRTNVAFMNASGQPTRVRLTMLNPDGSEYPPSGTAADTFTLAAWEPRQLNDVFAKLKRAYATNIRVRLEVLEGGPVVALGSLLDGRTNDPSTIQMTAGAGADGTWVARIDKTTYDTPLVLTVRAGAVVAFEATVLFTAEDVSGCSGGELLHFAGDLPEPVIPDALGAFAFSASGMLDGVQVTLAVSGTLSPLGGLAGTATTTLANVGTCSGSKSWPLAGARLP